MSTVLSRLLGWLRALPRGRESAWVEPWSEITKLALGGPILLPVIRWQPALPAAILAQPVVTAVAAAPATVAAAPAPEPVAVRHVVVDDTLEAAPVREPIAFPSRAA